MPQGPNSPYTELDQNQILQRVFEESYDRLRVDAEVTATIGTVECIIDANSGDNISISDGANNLSINPDGSINVKVNAISSENLKTNYNEITDIASGVSSSIINFTPGVNIKILGINVSGTNIATYEVLKNLSIVDKKYTYFGNSLSTEFNLNGLLINSGQNIKINVVHNRPSNGNFNATIKYIEI